MTGRMKPPTFRTAADHQPKPLVARNKLPVQVVSAELAEMIDLELAKSLQRPSLRQSFLKNIRHASSVLPQLDSSGMEKYFAANSAMMVRDVHSDLERRSRSGSVVGACARSGLYQRAGVQ